MEYKLTGEEIQREYKHQALTCSNKQAIKYVADAASDKAYKAIVALIKQKRDELVTKRNNIDENHEHFLAAYRELTLQVNLLYELLKEIGEA